MPSEIFDLAIIGGGINGTGIAADAAGRGLSVVLFEKGDLGSGTSSASSKLIHGGLRYLEHFEFRLVREALAEREVLLARAPHLIRPLRFIIPHGRGMRSRALLRAGLFLYDHLAERKRIPASESLVLAHDPAGRPLRPDFKHGFSYYDCWVDDARLVTTLAIDAAERGAVIHTRTPATQVSQSAGVWHITAGSGTTPITVEARALVNAAGPWCAEVAGLIGPASDVPKLRLVRGSHIVVPRIPGAEDAYLLQSPDGRVVFALPYEGRFTMIGTTDFAVATPDEGFTPSEAEETYLLETAARFFSRPIARETIVWRFAGVRPLVEDGARKAAAVSRDYRLDLIRKDGSAPLLNIIGGKITTFRRLAEAALARLAPFLPGSRRNWTERAALPGGDFGPNGFASYCADLARRHPAIDHDVLLRLASLYGTRAEWVLGDAKALSDLGAPIGAGLTEREVIYLRDHEWARTPQDVLWRRTKAGLHLNADAVTRAEQTIAKLLGGAPSGT